MPSQAASPNTLQKNMFEQEVRYRYKVLWHIRNSMDLIHLVTKVTHVTHGFEISDKAVFPLKTVV